MGGDRRTGGKTCSLRGTASGLHPAAVAGGVPPAAAAFALAFAAHSDCTSAKPCLTKLARQSGAFLGV
jgi:hypothetical protein